MYQPSLQDAWVYTLTKRQLLFELSRRQLSTVGTLPTLRDRLLRHARTERGDITEPPSPEAAVMSNPPIQMGEGPLVIDAHASDPVHESPSEGNAYDNPRNTRRTSMSWENSRDSNTVAAYNIMRKWNLRFSGSKTEDPEAFLVRIEEGRALIPVADLDLLRCVTKFLKEPRVNTSRWLII